MESFIVGSWSKSWRYQDSGPWPSSIFCLADGDHQVAAGETLTCFAFSGHTEITNAQGQWKLLPGMYAAIPGPARLSNSGKCMLMLRHAYQGFFQLGGPIEATGRLAYIDGCTDSLLLAPPCLGDPCLNLLHIPAGTEQTQHTHPSLRAGMVVSGTGCCMTPTARHDLHAGMGFVIPAEGQHSFHTATEDLLVIAWHPDSDTGPSHDDHPMLNRTIVDGTSARHLDIRTVMETSNEMSQMRS